MTKAFNVVKWAATLGPSPQTFLGAKWVRYVLKRTPEEKKRLWALRMLSLSPHYFFNADTRAENGLSETEYFELEYNEGVRSRKNIFENVVSNYVKPTDAVLDYGCGPGYLARIVAENVRQVYACDISEGALACAHVLNGSPNLEYVVATAEGLNSIPDESIDVVVSFALIQHLTDETFDKVLANCERKLKPGGTLLLHFPLKDDLWKTEDEWRSDTSIKGRLRFRYGLHCFGRSEEAVRSMVERRGFNEIGIKAMSEFLPEPRKDDVWPEHLLTAKKAGSL